MDDTPENGIGEGRGLLMVLCLAPCRGHYYSVPRDVLKSTTQLVNLGVANGGC